MNISDSTSVLTEKSKVKIHSIEELETLREQACKENDEMERTVNIGFCILAKSYSCGIGYEARVGENFKAPPMMWARDPKSEYFLLTNQVSSHSISK